MTKSFLWLLQVSLFAATFQPIVCPSGEMFASRRDRSSHIDTSQYVSDSTNNVMDSFRNANRSRKPLYQPQQQQQQQQHFNEPNVKIVPSTNLSETIRSIFQLGDEKGLTLFNRPTEAHPTIRTKNKDFVFPDPSLRDNSFGLQPKCEEGIYEGKPFCTKVRNYPEFSQLETILQREFSKFEIFFGEDLAQPQNITQRMNHEPDEEYLCNSSERIIYPEAGTTKDNNWFFIVNNHNKYKQGVRIEQCQNEGSPCNFMASFPNNYNATCKQNYIYRPLVAITPDGNITKDYFKMPSCCKCVLKQNVKLTLL